MYEKYLALIEREEMVSQVSSYSAVIPIFPNYSNFQLAF
jgi:hypothetical protein